MYKTAEDEIMEDVAQFNQSWEWDWFNSVMTRPERNSKFRAMCNEIAKTAYEKIREKI